MIHFKNIYKSFGRQEVLKGVDIELYRSGVYAVLGPNGSGKTTLVKTLMGMVHADRGKILFEGKRVKGDDYRRNISYLPQIARFPENLTTWEFLQLIENIRGNAQRKEELIENFELTPFLHKTLRHLSGGTRQKINITAALMYDTRVLLLDEPTIGLDPVALLMLKKWVRGERAAGKIILITTHVMNIVQELADQIVFVLDGKIYYRGDQQKLFEITGTADVEHAIAQLLTRQKTPQHA